MKKEELMELPYPMFKVNWWEKIVLKWILKKLEKQEIFPYICVFSLSYPFTSKLRSKIRKAIDNEDILCLYLKDKTGVSLIGHARWGCRILWIEKLLEFNSKT